MRIRKDYTAPNGYWVLSDETRYVYDGMLVVQERYSSGVPRFAYSRGQDLSGSLQGAGGIGGMLARSSGYSSSTGGWGYNYTYHADGGGNITYAVASNGTKMAEYRYDSFGRTLSVYEQRAFTGNRYRFSSKEVHLRSGMYYYGYRFYDPYTQRWLNRDPIEEEGGINLYQFVYNSPLNWIDDFGGQARPPMPGRPGPRMPGGPRNRGGPSHRYPNAPLPYIPPRPPNPNNQWPGGRQPSMCITIPVLGRDMQRAGRRAEAIAQHLLGDPSAPPCPPPPPSPCPPKGPSLPPYIPNSGSYVNAPPDLGLTTPPTPPRTIFLPRDSGPVIVAPGTIIIWY